MKYILAPIFLIISTYCYSQLQNILIKDKFSAIAYIESNVPQNIIINGKKYDLLLSNEEIVIPYTKKSTGTGFIVRRDVDFYLVTATHVATSTNLLSNVSVGNKNGKSIKYTLDEIRHNKSSNWHHHPIGDISVIQLNAKIIESDNIIEGHNFYFILNDNPPNERSIEISVIGFPLGIGVNKIKVEPISKTNRIASGIIETPRGDTKKLAPMFFTDDPSTSGFSGAPVFITDEEYYSGLSYKSKTAIPDLIGVVHGTVSDETGGKFGAVTPSYMIVETIESCGGTDTTKIFTYNDGQKWASIEYRNGSPYNVLYSVKKDGTSYDYGTLKNGSGTLIFYYEDGRVQSEYEYENGSIVKSVIYPVFQEMKEYHQK